jgi:hypothetical protein
MGTPEAEQQNISALRASLYIYLLRCLGPEGRPESRALEAEIGFATGGEYSH